MSHKVHPIPGVLFSALGTNKTVSAGIVLLFYFPGHPSDSAVGSLWEVFQARPSINSNQHGDVCSSPESVARPQQMQLSTPRSVVRLCTRAHFVPGWGKYSARKKRLTFSLSLNLSICLHRLPRKLEEHPEGFVPVTIPDLAVRLREGESVIGYLLDVPSLESLLRPHGKEYSNLS